MDTRRLVLFVIFSMSLLMLWESWQAKNTPPAPVNAQVSSDPSVPNLPASPAAAGADTPSVDASGVALSSSERFVVKTDLYEAEIDSVGGDLRKLTLLKHRADDSDTENFVLLNDEAKPMVYVAQTGLLGADLPTHKSAFTADAKSYDLQAGSDNVAVKLNWANDQYAVEKQYVFHRDNYVIDVNYAITNHTGAPLSPAVYYQIIHDDESNQGSAIRPTFTGGTYYTEDKHFNKVAFDEMADEPLNLMTNDGWVGLLQHYFVSAWIPQDGIARTFYSKQLDEHLFSIGTKSNLQPIAPNATGTVTAKLFAGPQSKRALTAAAPGLEHTVDYGMLKIIATPIFWLLDKIHGLVHNWGVAIIILTLLIKLFFFPLSAKSYRSMAKMRELAPRLQSMKEKFGDDRQKMQMAMMDLYKKEKVNPMSGCLPILIQIPVFISLYWVLLGSVELRHAPFFGWIQDLSATDPYYILPLLMGASMIIQTSLNPAPTDPIQAKVMKIMPVVFSIFFFFFPAGLVLYWLVNNVVSIWQQWYINKSIHAETVAKQGNAGK